MEENYFNIRRPSHNALLSSLQNIDIKDDDDYKVVKYGKSTQHIFKDGSYMMTIDWSKV